ncbi:hypothetical protein Desti_5094 [Desulfomonile tiedjei DSM 6799]|uniref:Uncharacterized protein n=1 Tax=Desulfomonile tiedjei (strain ATCC 49306 / DSM 6799 / DCB-1) TaxID=706587 RepID=I4CDR3_DESTA|nr:hypothetical protein Desti_5094 [Desulfomonile tiedjei DSM 6799]
MPFDKVTDNYAPHRDLAADYEKAKSGSRSLEQQTYNLDRDYQHFVEYLKLSVLMLHAVLVVI